MKKKPNIKKTPLQAVRERFGSKDKLVGELLELIKRPSDVSKDDFKTKLQAQSNKKLMNLLERERTLTERFGGREKLIEALLKSRMGGKLKEDQGYRRHLEKRTNGQLLDMARRLKIS